MSTSRYIALIENLRSALREIEGDSDSRTLRKRIKSVIDGEHDDGAMARALAGRIRAWVDERSVGEVFNIREVSRSGEIRGLNAMTPADIVSPAIEKLCREGIIKKIVHRGRAGRPKSNYEVMPVPRRNEDLV
jgi:hypothetical protein